MTTETEKKIQLKDENTVNSILLTCRTLFGQYEKINQTDEYFDDEQETLKKKDFTVRLRLTDGKAKIALKSSRIKLDSGSYTRVDLEFSVNEEEIRRELAKKDLKATAIIDKIRWKFKKEKIKVTIDRYPFSGFFLEVEAPDEQKIEEVLSNLNLSSEASIQKNSTELIEEKLSEIGLPLRPNLRATFELEDEWKIKQ